MKDLFKSFTCFFNWIVCVCLVQFWTFCRNSGHQDFLLKAFCFYILGAQTIVYKINEVQRYTLQHKEYSQFFFHFFFLLVGG